MIEMCEIVNYPKVDEWDTPENPIPDSDRLFRNVKGEIILPIAELYYKDPSKSALDKFAMMVKRAYNSDQVRNHICKYLNYFEKFYDPELLLFAYMAEIKYLIDTNPNFTQEHFMDLVNRYIIKNVKLSSKIHKFVTYNYAMKLSSNNNKTPNLQFNNRHAQILYEISLMTSMYIPLACHFMYVNNISKSPNIEVFMLKLFDLCNIKYKETENIDIYNKIYETALSVVNKSKNPDKLLWSKSLIRGINPTLQTKEAVIDVIVQIIPKYCYDNNIINFNYFSNRFSLKCNITDISYEFSFNKLSSSKRDFDQNSELDRYEANLNKKDEALAMQNKIAAEQTVNRIKMVWGPFDDKEIEHYRKTLTKNGSPLIHPLQKQFVKYLYARDFGDPETIKSIRNQTDYIILLIAAKRKLINAGLTLLPYIISSRVTNMTNRKMISKRDTVRIQNSNLYNQIVSKYNNPKLEQDIFEFIGSVISSSFEIIDWDNDKNAPKEYDGVKLPMHSDVIIEEMLFFILNI